MFPSQNEYIVYPAFSGSVPMGHYMPRKPQNWGILIKSLTPLTPGVSTLNCLEINELLSLRLSLEEASFVFWFSFFLPHQTRTIPLFLQMKPWSLEQYFAVIYYHLTPRFLSFSIWGRHTLNLKGAIQHFVQLSFNHLSKKFIPITVPSNVGANCSSACWRSQNTMHVNRRLHPFWFGI